MASVPADTFLTYDAIGNREDLIDIIYNVDPTDTIFISSIDHTSASSITHEWQTDGYDAVDVNNAHLSGEDAVTTAATPTVRLNNVTQISYKVPRVSGTQRAVDSAGRADEFSYQRAKMGVELKRDMESIVLENAAKEAGSAGVARLLGAILSWIGTNTNFEAIVGADPITLDGAAPRTDGTQRTFTEDMLKDVLNQCWLSGGNPNTIMLGAHNKQVASGFTGNIERKTEADRETLFTAITVYVSDFGTLNIRANRFMRQRDCLVLQMDMWALAFLPGRNMAEWDLAKTGDSDRAQVLSEYTLVARNEKASGGIFDLETA
jgi:hypothetical protein